VEEGEKAMVTALDLLNPPGDDDEFAELNDAPEG
jgi:hypothetical protein